jgi:hypothetical protein
MARYAALAKWLPHPFRDRENWRSLLNPLGGANLYRVRLLRPVSHSNPIGAGGIARSVFGGTIMASVRSEHLAPSLVQYLLPLLLND